MFCSKCGFKLDDGSAFCPKCGTAVDTTMRTSITSGKATERKFDSSITKNIVLMAVGVLFSLIVAPMSANPDQGVLYGGVVAIISYILFYFALQASKGTIETNGMLDLKEIEYPIAAFSYFLGQTFIPEGDGNAATTLLVSIAAAVILIMDIIRIRKIEKSKRTTLQSVIYAVVIILLIFFSVAIFGCTISVLYNSK